MKTFNIFQVTFALLMVLAIMPAPTHASGLTQSQISSILNLLISFGADQSVINDVAADLGATSIPTQPSSGAPSLSISVDPASPAARSVGVGTTGQLVGVFRVAASGDSIALDKITLALGDQATPSDIGPAYIYDGSTLIGTVIFSPLSIRPQRYVATSTIISGVVIPKDGIKIFTVRTDITSYARIGDIVSIGMEGVHGFSSATGFVASTYYGGFSQGVTIAGTDTSVSNIYITAPNGGEAWEIGQLNSITWAPYSYTPTTINGASQVTVYLERLDGTRVGRVMDEGKASLHTYFNIDAYDKWATPGQYYVRAVNNVTGASDRSDAPFTLLPRGVDVKVNGSDGPLTLTDNQAVTVSILFGAGFQSCSVGGVRSAPGATPAMTFIPSGKDVDLVNGYAYAPVPGSSTSIYVTCYKADGSTRSDGVQVNTNGIASSMRVVSPNGGEQVKLGQYAAIQFALSGVKSYSVALYKNDQWMQWLTKDQPLTSTGAGAISYSWLPTVANLGAVNQLGNVFKIYITGQKADGTGYVDDKSDAPFSFVSTTPVCSQVPVVDCAQGYTLVSGGYDANSCKLADKCVAPTTTSVSKSVIVGALEKVGGLADWDEFVSPAIIPTLYVGNATGADVRPWIGFSSACTANCNRKQNIAFTNLVAGATQTFTIYPAHASSIISYNVKVISGTASISQGATFSFPQVATGGGYAANTTPITVKFVATTPTVTLQIGNDATSGNNYMYFDQFRFTVQVTQTTSFNGLFMKTVSLLSSGMAAVADGYLSMFGLALNNY
jgi:hypothetical protein